MVLTFEVASGVKPRRYTLLSCITENVEGQ
jgi:hypothetical protein